MLLSRFDCKFILSAFFIFVNFLIINAESTNSKLKLVQVLFRHGDRAPTDSYPKDKWKNAWPDGLGQLTTLGMQQQFATGEYLRQRYAYLINDTYNHNTVHVQSTNVDRTLMSAYANLAGFIPPTGRHVWNTNLTWQPIPVHTLPQHEDYVLSLNAKCAKYTKLYAEQMKSPEIEKVNLENKQFFKFLSKMTGLSINNFKEAARLHDIFLVEKIHNMDQPHWVDDDLMEKLSELHLFKVSFLVGTRELKRIRGGPLIGEMIKNMKKIIHNNADEHKIYMFSAHDSTILSFLSALDVYEPHAPPYCSMVMVELHEKNGIDFVKILYRNDTSRDPYELSLKGCTNQCLFEKFIKLTAAVIPEDIKAECVVHHESYNVALPSVIAGSIIGCGVLILLIAGYAFHKRKTASYGYINIDN